MEGADTSLELFWTKEGFLLDISLEFLAKKVLQIVVMLNLTLHLAVSLMVVAYPRL